MAKKSIVSQIKAMKPDNNSKPMNCLEALRRSDKAAHDDLLEAMRDFAKFGHTRKVFPTIKSFWEYVTAQDGRLDEPVINVRYSQFGKWLKELERECGKA